MAEAASSVMITVLGGFCISVGGEPIPDSAWPVAVPSSSCNFSRCRNADSCCETR